MDEKQNAWERMTREYRAPKKGIAQTSGTPPGPEEVRWGDSETFNLLTVALANQVVIGRQLVQVDKPHRTWSCLATFTWVNFLSTAVFQAGDVAIFFVRYLVSAGSAHHDFLVARRLQFGAFTPDDTNILQVGQTLNIAPSFPIFTEMPAQVIAASVGVHFFSTAAGGRPQQWRCDLGIAPIDRASMKG